MNERHGLTKENLARSLPISLSGDPKMVALAEGIAEVLAQRREEIDRLAIYPNVDKLDEELLDILARDFKVDWWDSDYSLPEKRRTLQSSWQVHRTLGTKGAVLAALRAVFPGINVEEWYQYGGQPYWFRLRVQLSEGEWSPERHKRLMWRLQFFKNLRSHNEPVIYQMPPVILENTQAFYFVSLLIAAHIREPGTNAGPLFERLILSSRQRQKPGSLPWRMGALYQRQNRNEASLFRLGFRFWVSFFGWDTVFFNGHRRFDGSFIFDQKMEGPFLFERFQVRAYGHNWQYQQITGGASGAAAKVKTENSLALASLAFRTWVSFFGRDAVFFDGRRRFDGTFGFGQIKYIPFKLNHFQMRCRWNNNALHGTTVHGTARAHIRLENRQDNMAACRFRARQLNPRSTGPPELRFRAASANPQSAAAYLTSGLDRRWDGTYLYNGRINWDSKLIRREL